MILGNPVRSEIRPAGSPRIAGSFRVTQEYGCTGLQAEPKLGNCAHFHRGIDIGDGRCGAAVVAMADGVVKWVGKLGNGEIVVVLNHGNGWGTSYGHLAREIVSDGQRVTKGQKIGDIGDTGFAAGCHLHFAVKSGLPAGWGRLDFIPNAFGGRGDTTGKWRDPWPLLEQNQPTPIPEDDMPPLTTYIPGHSATVAKGFNIRSAPSTSSQVLRTLLEPETWVAFGWAKGEVTAGSDEWLVRWAGQYEYVHRSGVTGVTPPTGDCTAAVQAATDPLAAQLTIAQTELSQMKGRISNAVAALTQ